MIITMLRQLSGTRDGVDWPAPGESMEVPDDEGASLIDLIRHRVGSGADVVESPSEVGLVTCERERYLVLTSHQLSVTSRPAAVMISDRALDSTSWYSPESRFRKYAA